MATPDRRRPMHQAPLHKVATPPAPLLLMSASQSLTFSSDDVRMSPAVLMPVCQPAVPSAVSADSTADIRRVNSSIGIVTEPVISTSYQSDRSVSLPDSSSHWQPTQQPNTADLINYDYGAAMSFSQQNEFTAPMQDFYSEANTEHCVDYSDSRTSLQHNEIKQSSIESPALSSPSTIDSRGIASSVYLPVQFHWFFCRNVELRQIWQPFSKLDSDNLEAAYQNLCEGIMVSSVVSANGGRYDVDVAQRLRRAVYWEEPESYVRRCSWFYRADGDTRVVPYEEDFADRLEKSFRDVLVNGSWHQKLEYPEGDMIVIHSPTVIMHFTTPTPGQNWGAMMGEVCPPRSVKRGSEDFDSIPEDETKHIDFLVFVVHGIGPGCDLRFRNIVECVDDFRSVSQQMLASHFRNHEDSSRICRVEYLPVRWHSALHGDATGIDRKLKAITLNSIGRLRQFTNDTLLDVLFYGSPAYAQQIADTIGNEMNRLHELFCYRNPEFSGTVAVAGHSLGSLILFDLLVHQNASCTSEMSSVHEFDARSVASDIGDINADVAEKSQLDMKNQGDGDNAVSDEDVLTIEAVLNTVGIAEYRSVFEREQIDMDTLMICEANDLKEMGLPLGPRKKLLAYLEQKRQPQPKARSTHRPVEVIPLLADDCLNQSKRNSQDVDRCDPLLRSASNTSVNFVVGGAGTGVQLVSYPRLRFNPCVFFALGSPIAMFLTVRGVDALGADFRLPTCRGFFNVFHPFDPVAYRIEPLIMSSCPVKPVLMPHHKGRKRLHLELKDSLSRVGSDLKQKIIESVKSTWRTINSIANYHRSEANPVTDDTTPANADSDINGVVQDAASYYADPSASTSTVHEQNLLDEEYPVGQLNGGRRIDYVLQEKPIESVNDYLFALSSHACYWESEDTVLMILKELYSLMGISLCKSNTDLILTNQTIATFPRHPLAATAGLPNRTVPPWTAHQLSNSAVDTVGSAMSSGQQFSSYLNPSDSAISSSIVATPQSNIHPPGADVQPNFGPPPKSGFIRK